MLIVALPGCSKSGPQIAPVRGIVTLDGRLLALETAAYDLTQPEPDAAEQDGDAWWAALTSTTRRALERLGRDVHVIGVSIGGQAPTFIATVAKK